MFYPSIPVCFLVIGVAFCAPEQVRPDHDTQSPRDQPLLPEEHLSPIDKRASNFDHNMAKRAYSYVSEYKRLPVYNFGLGKRSRPYSFGLGKRSVDETQAEGNEIDQETLSDLLDQYDAEESPNYEVKRARPYSFGLGKRFANDDTTEEKRAKMYNFGLGKRLPMYNFGLGKRAKSYSFGLGKRLSSKFNFGLGKRERDLNRFSFGLGKRSNDESVNYYDL